MRAVAIAAGLLAWATGSAFAQEGRDRGQEWMLNRMKERLNLTDEQFAKIKDISQQSREQEEKAQKEREDKIREVLTEEQRKQFDEFRRNPMRGGGGGAPGGGGQNWMQGWAERFMAPALDTLKKELNLTDEQADKMKGALDDFNERVRQRIDDLRQNGFQGYNWQEEGQKFQESVKDLTEKLRAPLNDEQKEKLDKLMQDRFAWGGTGGGRPPGPPEGRRGNNRPSVDERVRRAMEALKVDNAEEAAALREAVKKVVEAQHALEDYERDARGKIDELARKSDVPDDEIRGKLDELRAGRREKDKAVKDAQKALAEIVTYRQELELIKAGILR